MPEDQNTPEKSLKELEKDKDFNKFNIEYIKKEITPSDISSVG